MRATATGTLRAPEGSECSTAGMVSWQGPAMPWVRATLRGKAVMARALPSGLLDAQDGRVEIRYNPRDGRMYRAMAGNLAVVDPTLLDDSYCGPAAPVGKPKPEGERETGRSARDPAAAKAARKTRSAAEVPARAPEGVSEAWTDGACSGNPGPAGLGVVLFHAGQRTELSEYLGTATNNIAELTAILRALEMVEPEHPLIIRTDSQYSIGVLQKGWKAKANTELVGKVKKALADRPSTKLAYTPGHAGVSLNERADQLATGAVSARKTVRNTYPIKQPAPSKPE